jgi:hypothetical protein
VAVSERDFLTERVSREIPPGILQRRLAFLLYSGSAGGLCWVACMSILTFGVSQFFPGLSGVSGLSRVSETSISFMVFMSYCLAYALFASLIRRKLLNRFIEARNTWVVALLVFTAFSIFPVFLGAFTGFEAELLMIGNPFMMTLNKDEGVLFGLVAFLLALILNSRWLSRQYAEFLSAGSHNDQQL